MGPLVSSFGGENSDVGREAQGVLESLYVGPMKDSESNRLELFELVNHQNIKMCEEVVQKSSRAYGYRDPVRIARLLTNCWTKGVLVAWIPQKYYDVIKNSRDSRGKLDIQMKSKWEALEEAEEERQKRIDEVNGMDESFDWGLDLSKEEIRKLVETEEGEVEGNNGNQSSGQSLEEIETYSSITYFYMVARDNGMEPFDALYYASYKTAYAQAKRAVSLGFDPGELLIGPAISVVLGESVHSLKESIAINQGKLLGSRVIGSAVKSALSPDDAIASTFNNMSNKKVIKASETQLIIRQGQDNLGSGPNSNESAIILKFLFWY